MIYKVTIHNKTKNKLYYKLYDCLSEKDISHINELDVDEIRNTITDSTITNINMWGLDETLSNVISSYNGTIPSNTYLEVFNKDNKLEIFLDNNKIPESSIKNIKDCNKINIPKILFYVLLFIIAILLIIFIIKKRKSCGSCKKR